MSCLCVHGRVVLQQEIIVIAQVPAHLGDGACFMVPPNEGDAIGVAALEACQKRDDLVGWGRGQQA